MRVETERMALRQAELFRALSHPRRLVIVECLLERERSVTELEHCERLAPASQPSLSQDLSILRSQGLVRARREGRRIVYSVRAPVLRRLLSLSKRLALDRVRSLL